MEENSQDRNNTTEGNIDNANAGSNAVANAANADCQENKTTIAINNESPASHETTGDYSNASKEELLNALLSLIKKDDFASIGNELKGIKNAFDEIDIVERKAAEENFVKDGGNPNDFKFQSDGVSKKFYAAYQTLKEKRQQHFKQLEKEKEANYKVKKEILEELRSLVDGEETTMSIKVIEQIREKWKSTGPIPRQYNKTLWANYNALMDRYYDKRSIYFELKELDRRKNLELKVALCEKAEALDSIDSIKLAVVELNNLHEEFKHIGPVPQENQDELWLRFKAASDNVYSKRKEYLEVIKSQLQVNLELKLALCEEAEGFLSFDSDNITDWSTKSKAVQALQLKWEKVGGVPRDKSKTVNRRFWSSIKGFFSHKAKFFKSVDSQKEGNLKLKEELIRQAEELKNSDEVSQTTANQFKKLQREWKDLGPVPDKAKREINIKFKAACDEFFDRLRASNKDVQKEFENNLKRKTEVCNQLEEIVNAENIDLDIVEELQYQFARIGFVPRGDMKEIASRYEGVLRLLKRRIKDSGLPDANHLIMGIDIRKMKGLQGSDKHIEKQGHSLRRQIGNIENDISTWKNNLEFFADSKTANELKKEFDLKIEAANQELKELKEQLRVVQSV